MKKQVQKILPCPVCGKQPEEMSMHFSSSPTWYSTFKCIGYADKKHRAFHCVEILESVPRKLAIKRWNKIASLKFPLSSSNDERKEG